jgi:hypothetical protein
MTCESAIVSEPKQSLVGSLLRLTAMPKFRVVRGDQEGSAIMLTRLTRLLSLAGMTLLLAGIAAWADPPRGPAEPEIWIKSGARPADNVWPPDAPWPAVAARVKVADFPPGNIAWAKDADLQAAFRDMKRRNIALALEFSLLTRSDRCQARNEATSAPGELEQYLAAISVTSPWTSPTTTDTRTPAAAINRWLMCPLARFGGGRQSSQELGGSRGDDQIARRTSFPWPTSSLRLCHCIL